MEWSSVEATGRSLGYIAFFAVGWLGVGATATMLQRASVRERIRRARAMRVAAWWAGVAAVWMSGWILLPLGWMLHPRSPLVFYLLEVVLAIIPSFALAFVIAALACTAVWVAARLAPG